MLIPCWSHFGGGYIYIPWSSSSLSISNLLLPGRPIYQVTSPLVPHIWGTGRCGCICFYVNFRYTPKVQHSPWKMVGFLCWTGHGGIPNSKHHRIWPYGNFTNLEFPEVIGFPFQKATRVPFGGPKLAFSVARKFDRSIGCNKIPGAFEIQVVSSSPCFLSSKTFPCWEGPQIHISWDYTPRHPVVRNNWWIYIIANKITAFSEFSESIS